MYSTNPSVDREWLFNKLPQEYLMEYYLGVPIQQGLVCSPLRHDRNPTCGFVRSPDGRILFHDLSGDFTGDCIAVVARIQNLSYKEAIQYVAQDQGLIDGTAKPIVKKEYPIIESTPAKIDVKLQEWSSDTLEYWSKYGISVQTLKTFNVFPLSVVWLNDKVYSIAKKYPIFGYYFGNDQWKIYWPHRKTRRFISNTNELQGWYQLRQYKGDSKEIVVTKSLKDVMVFHELGIPAIAPQGEAQLLSQDIYNILSVMFDTIVINYDNDLTGIRSMNKMKRMYNVLPLPLPLNEPKDISDFSKKYGIKATAAFVDQVRVNVQNGFYKNPYHEQSQQRRGSQV